MSFDARSRERLEALGRSLPKPLPTPTPPQQGTPKATDKRHRVEVEENPEALFRELMQVSPDGTVPPHLMERLREIKPAGRTLHRQPLPPRVATGPPEPTPWAGRIPARPRTTSTFTPHSSNCCWKTTRTPELAAADPSRCVLAMDLPLA
ncbi:hypothetical protein [Cyanobium sp. ATX 6E8]|uniref:hypothetical protein n=1 Tax=Cyanobium sp. ATX 6E8 TaxID=2823701 RepID=UPI0028F42540|nr:hypothetical protein [Cyanobium sp. ATX 6E8]